MECSAASGSSFEKLEAHILDRSSAPTWREAVQEWEPLGFVDERGECGECGGSKCPCGQHPIVERCWIVNRATGHETFVGNVCIRRFMSDNVKLRAWRRVDAGLKRIKMNRDAAPNAALIEFAAEKGWLRPATHEFLIDTCRKRNLTGRQLAWRRDANAGLIERMSRKPGRAEAIRRGWR